MKEVPYKHELNSLPNGKVRGYMWTVSIKDIQRNSTIWLGILLYTLV